jgi:hypothetical protein
MVEKEENMLQAKMDRRRALSTGGKAAIGAAAVVIIGGVAYYASTQAPAAPTTVTVTQPPTTVTTATTTATTVTTATTATTTTVEPTTTVVTTTVAPTTPTTPTAATGRELVMNAWSYRPDIVELSLSDFRNEYNEKGRLEVIVGDYPSIMETKFIAGATVDLCYAECTHVQRWYDAGWIRDLEDMDEVDKVRKDLGWSPQLLQMSTSKDGKLLGTIYFTSVTATVVRNDKLAEEIGMMEYPKDYDDMFSMCMEAKKKGVDQPMNPHWFKSWFGGAGRTVLGETMNDGDPLVDKNLDAVFDVDTPAADVLQRWKDYWDNDLVPKGVFTETEADFLNAFGTGKHLFHQQQLYDLQYQNNPENSLIAGHVTLVPGSSKMPVWGVQWGGLYVTPETRPQRTLGDLKRAHELTKFFGWRDKQGEFRVGTRWSEAIFTWTYGEVYEQPEVKARTLAWMPHDEDLEIAKSFIQKAPYHDALRAVWFPEWKARVDIDIADAVQGKISVNEAITDMRDFWTDLKKQYT